MTSWYFAPIAAAIILGMLANIQVLGQQASDRTIQFSQDSVNAIDCAFKAEPLTDCSPNLFSHNITEQVDQANAMLKTMQAQNQEYLASQNLTTDNITLTP